MYRPCDPYILCGISSRFQLLSPTERQVPHALLTRSPLSDPRRNHPVRLACVRHAASVRPEPGSNSQKFVSKLLPQLKSTFWIIRSSKYTQEFSLAVNFDFTSLKQSIIIVQGVFLVSCYSIYKVHPVAAATLAFYHRLFLLSRTFFKFFQISFLICSFLPAPLSAQI